MEAPDQDLITHEYGEAVAISVSPNNNQYPGMTYIEGVRDALAWVIGESDESPLEEAAGYQPYGE